MKTTEKDDVIQWKHIWFFGILLCVLCMLLMTCSCVTMNTPFGSGTVQGNGSNVSVSGYAAPGQTLKITAEVGVDESSD